MWMMATAPKAAAAAARACVERVGGVSAVVIHHAGYSRLPYSPIALQLAYWLRWFRPRENMVSIARSFNSR